MKKIAIAEVRRVPSAFDDDIIVEPVTKVLPLSYGLT
jgi:hypothetical protein